MPGLAAVWWTPKRQFWQYPWNAALVASVTSTEFLWRTRDALPVGGDPSLRLRDAIMGFPKNGIEYLEGSVVSE